MLGLTGCAASSDPILQPPPPEVIEVPVPQYRELPDYCFASIEARTPTRGATNEDLVRALRDALTSIDEANETLAGCAELRGEPPEGPVDGEAEAGDASG